MMLKWLIRWTRPLLAILATVVLALSIGHLATGPSSPAPRNQFDEILPRAGIQVPHLMEVQVLLPSGAPAVNAVVVMVEPELAAAHTDSQGMALLSHLTTGPVRLQAYLPNHELLIVGPASADERQIMQLVERQLKEIKPLLPEELVRVDFEMLDQNNKALADLILRTVPALQETPIGVVPMNLAPWVSISETDGWARLDGVPEVELRVEAYSPTLPISPAWLLGTKTILPKDGADIQWKLAVTTLRLTQLPPGELLHGKRIDPEDVLPLTRIPANGIVTFPVVPPGDYQFTVAEQTFTVSAAAGIQEFKMPALTQQ